MLHSQLARVYAELFATVVIAQNGTPGCHLPCAVNAVTGSLNAVMNFYTTAHFLAVILAAPGSDTDCTSTPTNRSLLRTLPSSEAMISATHL